MYTIAQPVYTVQVHVGVPSPYLQTGRRSKEHRYFFLGYIRGRGWNRDRNWSRGGRGECGLGDWGGGGGDVSAMVLSSVGLQGGHSLVAALAHCVQNWRLQHMYSVVYQPSSNSGCIFMSGFCSAQLNSSAISSIRVCVYIKQVTILFGLTSYIRVHTCNLPC